MLTKPFATEIEPRVTRTEILQAVRPAFAGAGATKSELIAAAETAHARSEVVALLRRLQPNVDLRHVRELWAYLPDLPVT